MNKLRATGITLIALSMGLGQLAMAQGRGDDRGGGPRDDRGAERRGPPERNGALRPDGSSRWDGPRVDDRRDARREGRPFHRDAPRFEQPQRGPGYGGPAYGGPVYGGPVYSGPHRGDWRHDRRGAGPRHDLYRGGHLPPQYRGRGYVVDDWRGHRLSAPPRGYHWVQTGGDYVLAAIATGVILNILLNN
jgi:Ni/Co efflux regulator RcnB